jgi:CheY-like chemotaxis protein
VTAPGEDQTLLLVLDDPEEAAEIGEYLAARGYRPVVARSGPEALHRFASDMPAMAVVNVLLEGMDGFLVCKAIKQTKGGGDFPVVLTSGVFRNRQDVTRRLMDCQANAYLTRPYSADQLLGVVDKFLSGKARRPVTADLSLPSSKRFEGDLSQSPLAEVMYTIYAESASGRLTLSRGDEEKELLFLNGWPVSANSNVKGERLGDLLVERRRITIEECANAIAGMADGALRFGQVLVANQVISAEVLYRSLQEQIGERVIRAFAWEEGTFRFLPDETFVNNVLPFDLHPTPLIMEGVRKHTTNARAERLRESLGGSFPTTTRNLKLFRPQLRLPGTAAHLLDGMDGRTTLEDLLAPLDADADEAFLALLGLHAVRAIEFAEEAVVVEEAKGTDEAPASAAPASESIPDIFAVADEGVGRRIRTPTFGSERAQRVLVDFLDRSNADHYELLGVSRKADVAEVERNTVELLRFYEPDVVRTWADGEVRRRAFQLYARIVDAKAVLSDPTLRAVYDETLDY